MKVISVKLKKKPGNAAALAPWIQSVAGAVARITKAKLQSVH